MSTEQWQALERRVRQIREERATLQQLMRNTVAADTTRGRVIA